MNSLTRDFCVKEFDFHATNKKKKIHVSIPEVLDPQYGMYVWPSAPVLAQFIWNQRSSMNELKVLELGAGTALPGIVAAKLGADVILSDACHLPQCQDNCRKSCQANNLQDIPVVGITWGQFGPAIIKMQPLDIILGSDCFYDSKDFEDIIVTVSYLLKKNSKTEFWTTYQERSSSRTIEPLLVKWNLSCVQIPLESFDADIPDIAGSELPGNHVIQMLIIKNK